MRCNTILFIVILSSLVFGLPKEAEALPANFTLSDGSPGFHLNGPQSGYEIVAGQYNPKELGVDKSVPWGAKGGPGGGNAPDINFTDARNPVISLSALSGISEYSFFWGMYPHGWETAVGIPSGIRFSNLPSGLTRGSGPNSLTYDFGATDGTNIFEIHFAITGSTPLDPLTWGWVPPGPPDFPAMVFNFSFQAQADPTLSFTVFENGQQLSFTAAIPEPETYAMMLAGLGLLGFMAKRRNQKEAGV